MRAALDVEVPDPRHVDRRAENGLEGGAGAVLSYPGWQDALNRLRGVVGQGGVAILVGLPGVGKTAMLRLVAADVATRTRHRWRRTAEPVLLDDSQFLSHEAFDAALRTQGAVVLAGEHGLVERLGNQRRAVTVIELPPLQPDDYADLLAALLHGAGEPSGLIPPEVATALGRHAGGRPGPLIALTRLAIFLAHLEGVQPVQPRHVEEAADVSQGVDLRHQDPDPDPADPLPGEDDLPPPHPRRWPRRLLVAIPAVAALLVVLPHGVVIEPSSAPVDTPGAPTLPAAAPNVAQVPVPVAPSIVPPVMPLVAPLATPVLPLPNPMLQVNITVPANDPAAMDRGQQIAATLQQAGYDVGEPTVANPAPSEGVRYFYLPDRSAALRLAATLGNAAPVLLAGPGQVQSGRTQPGPAIVPRPGSAEIGIAPTMAFPAPRADSYNRRRLP